MSGPDAVTFQRLKGGTKWHCTDVECRYVAAADLPLTGEKRDVYWDGEQIRASDDDRPVALANVCNHCQSQLGWTSAEERFAAARRRHGPTERSNSSRSGWRSEDS